MKITHCNDCDGKGRIKMYQISGIYWDTRVCTPCQGTGHIIEEE